MTQASHAAILKEPGPGALARALGRAGGPPGWPAAGTDSFSVMVLLAGLVALLAAQLALGAWAQLALALTAAILFCSAGLQAGLSLREGLRARAALRLVLDLVEDDRSACFVTDASGALLGRNGTARALPAIQDPKDALGARFADPEAALLRLLGRARSTGHAEEDLVTRQGSQRIAVRRFGPRFLWRLEDAGGAERSPEPDGVPVLTLGPGGTILGANDAGRRLLGGPAQHLDQLVCDLPLVPGRVQRFLGPAGPVERLLAEVPRGDGRTDVYLLPPPAKGLPDSAVWHEVEDLPVPLLKISPGGEVLAANREARILIPMPIGPGTRLSDLLEGMGRSIIDWLADVTEGRPSPGPQFLRGTGPHRDTFLRVALSPAGQPDDRHLIAVLHDVTELKSLEAQFVQSQKMQALGQLAGGVAHDFNNLLTAIAGHCDLLLLRHDEGDQEYADLIQIHQNVNRAASLVGQLLAFSRKQSQVLETLDLRDALADLTHLLNRLVGERVRLTLNHGAGLHRVRADRRQLEQVIVNLAVNARDAMPEGGEIRIETENLRIDAPLERDRATLPPGSYVLVRVTDEGIGIPPERLPKIFEPFYTTKKPGEGTGLGLSTAYGIVKQTGGYIFAESEMGRGTTFTLWFPAHLRAEVPAAPTPAARPAAPRRKEGVVLLVEDEAPVRAFAARALRLRGHTVLEAESGEAALEVLSDPGLRVDLFLTDVMMPGKDGPTWVGEALRDRPGTPVVFVSGYAEDAFSERRAMLPDSVFLPKPYSLAELTRTVQERIG